MKNTLLACLAVCVLGAGCTSPSINPNPDQGATITSSYNQDVTLNVNDTAVFDDGLRIKLLRMNDSRCPPDVACIWAGELSATLEVHQDLGDTGSTDEVTLGTISKPQADVAGYHLELAAITETSATVLITK